VHPVNKSIYVVEFPQRITYVILTVRWVSPFIAVLRVVRLTAPFCAIIGPILSLLVTFGAPEVTVKADWHIPCRSPAVLKPDSHIHAVPLLSPSSNYLLLNYHHNRCAVKYTCTKIVSFSSSMTNVVCFTLNTCIWDWLEIRVVAESRRTLAGRQHAVPTLFPCRHPATTLLWPWEVAFRKA
jgi:hypothetical protein